MSSGTRGVTGKASRKKSAAGGASKAPVITLLTDFGIDDIYVGVMKGVIASIAPRARIIDITHGVAPQDVLQGGLRWSAAVPYFPPGTIHVGVVDPGVGGDRAVLAMKARGSIFLAPDNGLLSMVADSGNVEQMVMVRESRYFLPEVSPTFHGRDIFAPVAARLALGLPLKKLGPPAPEMVRIGLPRAERTASRRGIRVVGEIVDIDKFGNCITNILVESLGGDIRDIRVGRWRFAAPVVSYVERRSGEPLAVVGSMGFLEIAVNRGRADRVLGLRRGQRVTARIV